MTYNPVKEHRKPLTPGSVQFLFLDLHPSIVEGSKTNPPKGLVRSAVAVARMAKLLFAPIHLGVVDTGSGPSLPSHHNLGLR